MLSVQLTEQEVQLSPADAGPDAGLLIAGLVQGLEQKDLSKDLAQCSAAEQKMLPAIKKVVMDMQAHTLAGLEQAVTDAKAVLEQLKASVPECAAANADTQKVTADVETMLAHLQTLPAHGEAFVANAIAHKDALLADADALQTALQAQDAATVGLKVGDILRISLLDLPNDDEPQFNIGNFYEPEEEVAIVLETILL